MKAIGIIPARGGSKGVYLKNIKKLRGKPLIQYTIESAISSGVFDEIVVSTDHTEIKEVCNKYKKIKIIDRPREISRDDSPTVLTLIHTCEFLYDKYGFKPNFVLLLEPTSPLRSASTIINCLNILKNTDADSVVGVKENNCSIGRISNKQFVHLFPNMPRRRQDREPLFQESGTIWGTTYEVLTKKKSMFGERIHPLIIDHTEAYDINDEKDFRILEAIWDIL
tara:strand:+ start:1231 stop:1902 length:672 start_codon:yes stop_codon:yes gene_type:complete